MKKFNLFYIKISIAILIIAVLRGFFWARYVEIENPQLSWIRASLLSADKKPSKLISLTQKAAFLIWTLEIIQDNKGQIIADKKIPPEGKKQENFIPDDKRDRFKTSRRSGHYQNYSDRPISFQKSKLFYPNRWKLTRSRRRLIYWKLSITSIRAATGFIAYQSSKHIALDRSLR